VAEDVQHKHLIVRAEVSEPPKDKLKSKIWMMELIENIGMKLLKGPYAEYVTKEGNKGVTCVAIIETSHLAMHIWDEVDPALLQLDVYTCGPLDPQIVFSAMQVWKPVKIEWKFLDREHNLKQLDANPFPSPGESIH